MTLICLYLCTLAEKTWVVEKYARRNGVHPTKPIKDEDFQEFRIDKEKHTQCTLNEHTYKVKRIDEKLTTINSYYYAIRDTEFNEIDEDSYKRRFKDQIGYAWCTQGVIDDILVHTHPVNARRCGIGEVLAELCLIDLELNKVDDENKSVDDFDDEQTKTLVKTYCDGLVGFTMGTLKGAYIYFSAAINSGYGALLIKDRTCGHGYFILNVDAAQRKYNEGTGEIDDIPALSETWYICRYTKDR